MNKVQAGHRKIAAIKAQIANTPNIPQNRQLIASLNKQLVQANLQTTANMSNAGAITTQHKQVSPIPTRGRDANAIAIADHANKTGSISMGGLAHIMSTDMPSFFEAFVHNNPAGVNHYLLNTLGFKALGAHPSLPNIFGQLKLILNKAHSTGDYSILKNMLLRVPFNQAAANYTTQPALWNALGVPYGNFALAFAKYYNV